ncbi:DMT family transporter [Parasphingorhabdus sp. DH2-15]|uniref:DMT family transporter n=1 Tax=Parasphingorhabdus sp. DH2-15 TaxID=3444112 RepID=UPI003F682B16
MKNHDEADNIDSSLQTVGQTSARNNIGAALMTTMAGFALLSTGDSIIKSVAGQWPSTSVAALRFLLGAIGLGLFLYIRQGREGFILPMPFHQVARGFCLAVATAAFFASIFLMPLADATAIVFISPALTSLISAIVLGERIPNYVWHTIMLALIGVILVLRPNFADLGIVAALPLVAASAMSCLMLLNRKVAGSGSVLLMQFLLALFAAPVLIIASVIGHFTGLPALSVDIPSVNVILVCTIVAFTASASHALIYLGTTKASASTVAPTTYIQLIVALTLGAVVYHDYPDIQSLSGAALIILSGLYLWRRGNAAG